jgi:uncharacterized membrane protein
MRAGRENAAELELLRAQRAQLASRRKTPWWYVGGSALAWVLAFAMPIASRYLSGASLLDGLLAVALLLLLQHALARVSGVDVGTRTWQYPSGRPWTIALVVIILANSVVDGFLLEHGQLTAAIVTGVLAALAGTGCWLGHQRGIRRDLETGTGAT